MNAEIRLFAALLSANKAEQETFWVNRPPVSVFKLHPNVADWVFQYRDRHGKFPTRGLTQERFGLKIPRSAEIISEALEPILIQSAYVQINQIVTKVADAFNRKASPSEIVGEFKSMAEKLSSYSSSFSDEKMSNATLAFSRYMQEVENGGDLTGTVTSPWENLTKIIGGRVRAGEVVVLAARPFTGKSWILLEWMRHIAMFDRKDVLLISKEMPVTQVSDRLTALRFKLPYLKFRNRELPILDQVRWKLGVLRKEKFPILISGEETFRGTSLDDVYNKVKKERPSVLAIDGAYLLTVDGIPAHKEREKFAAISQGAKRIAKACNIPVFLVLQMNREADHLNRTTGESESKGGLSTLYGADAWGQDADYVIELRGKVGSKERTLQVHKARDGGIGGAIINFDLDRSPNFSPKTVAQLEVKLAPL